MSYSRRQKAEVIGGRRGSATEPEDTFYVSLQEASRLIEWGDELDGMSVRRTRKNQKLV